MAYAVVASWLTPDPSKGFTTSATCGPSDASVTSVLIAERFSVAVTFYLAGATKTIRALDPSASVPGNCSLMRS